MVQNKNKDKGLVLNRINPPVDLKPLQEAGFENEKMKHVVHLNENQLRVQFREAHAKDIVSCHSGSILSAPEPVINLTDAQKDQITTVFNELASTPDDAQPGGGTIEKSSLGNVLVKSGMLRHDNDVVNTLISRYAGNEPICLADVMEFARQIHAPTYHYGNRLRRAVDRGEVNAVAELLVRGCNPNCQDGEGLTPLHYACEYGKLDIIHTLFDKAGDLIQIDIKDKYGWSPLFTAVHHGNHPCVKALIRKGCNVNLVNDNGKTALHIACGQNRKYIVETLVASGSHLTTQVRFVISFFSLVSNTSFKTFVDCG